MRNLLARPVDRRLFFAGEATNKDFFGTAHGAYWSGLRAARELLAS
jgi:monoamine oxidase